MRKTVMCIINKHFLIHNITTEEYCFYFQYISNAILVTESNWNEILENLHDWE